MGRSAHQARIRSCTRHIDYISPHSVISDIKHTRNANIESRAIVRTSGNILNLSHGKHSFNHFAEDNMLSVQKSSRLRGNKKLG